MSSSHANSDLGPIQTSDPIRDAWRHFRQPFAIAVFVSLVINVLMLASPLFMLQVYDRVLTSRSLPTLIALLGLVAGVFVVSAVLEAIRQRLMARIAAGVSDRLAPQTYSAVLHKALNRGSSSGDATQPARDLEAVRQYLGGSGPTAFFDLPWMPIYLGFAYLLHPLLGTMTLVAAIVLFCLAFGNERATKRHGLDGSRHKHRSLILIEGASKGAEVLRAMGMEQRFRDRWSGEHGLAQVQQLKGADAVSAFTSSTRMLRLFLQSAVLALGAALAIEGQVSAGTIIAASIIMSRALAPVEQITAQWGAFQATRRAIARLRSALIDVPRRSDPMALPTPKGDVAVENLVVGAPGANRPIVSGLNFSLEPGDGLGIVGHSGSGKSSLVRALAGVWTPIAGSIRLDGARLDQWPGEQIGAAVGYVPQDVEILSGTVTENISRFAPGADPADVVRAAQRANVHDMILRLPNGYQTELGEGGLMLSAGQRQRIALARALYLDPVLLVLDEPNSNLDGPGEAALIDTLLNARKVGVTVIIVSHRPATLQVTNKVLCLQDGRQAAFGPRDEILSAPRPRPANFPIAVAGGSHSEQRAS